MKKPKPLSVHKPVKLIFAGGFLGSGKTTALGALARNLIRQGKRVGIVTNDQSANLADTVIVQQMLAELGVPVREVVKGCFCCKFDELIDEVEHILEHRPDVLLGEPVGSCTDFVAAVANPIKIYYRDAFRFAPFTTMVDPDRVRELLLGETESTFPEEVAYLFAKQLEEADLVILNKIDLLTSEERTRLAAALAERLPGKEILPVSALRGDGMADWLQTLMSGRPGADTVLRQIDYQRYARAEAVLGWLNAAVRITGAQPFDTGELMTGLMVDLRDRFRQTDSGIGHLKFVMTSGGKSTWINLTRLEGDPQQSAQRLARIDHGTLIINARVQIEPQALEEIVREAVGRMARKSGVDAGILDLQCFSPAYPDPPYLMRDTEAAPSAEREES